MTAIGESALDQSTDRPQRVTYGDFVRTGPGTLAGRYMRAFWQPVRIAADLQPGRALPIRIMSEDFTLYRGEASPHPSPLPEGEGTGQPHLLAFRCAHRGTQLSTGWVEGDNLRCFYHGWTYGPDGQCVEQPAEPEPFCSRIRIRSYPTREYLGLIFAYLGEGEPPEFPRLAEYEHPEFVQEVSALAWPGNFFAQIDNAVDQCHTAITHWHFKRGIPTLTARETEYGMISMPVGEGFDDPSHFFMPNAHEWGSGPSKAARGPMYYSRGWRVPIDDRNYWRFGVDLYFLAGDDAAAHRGSKVAQSKKDVGAVVDVGNAVLTGKLDVHELNPSDYPNLVNIQDFVAQVGLGDIAAHPIDEHLGRSDIGINMLRRIWARELEAVASGRPLHQWRRPEGLWNRVYEAGSAKALASMGA
ncbi:MAG: pobA 2 [Chloroflexi bacterium]|nr:pobA 2 [Chloroflexota bacterium]